MRVGWPMRSMEGAMWFDAPEQYQYQRAFEFGKWPSGLGIFPVGPLWLGFIVNTLFYAALLWLLIPGPFVLRRVIRVRRGRCGACGYPMGESPVCTECGKPLPPHAVAET